MKIVVGLAAFMIFIVSIGVYMVSQDSDTLLDDNYYEKGLSYDDVYQRKQNLVDDEAKPSVMIDRDSLVVTFVQYANTGELLFTRPSDGKLDQRISFTTATNKLVVPLASFSKGNWSLEISWQSNNRSYIDTRPLFIQ